MLKYYWWNKSLLPNENKLKCAFKSLLKNFPQHYSVIIFRDKGVKIHVALNKKYLAKHQLGEKFITTSCPVLVEENILTSPPLLSFRYFSFFAPPTYDGCGMLEVPRNWWVLSQSFLFFHTNIVRQSRLGFFGRLFWNSFIKNLGKKIVANCLTSFQRIWRISLRSVCILPQLALSTNSQGSNTPTSFTHLSHQCGWNKNIQISLKQIFENVEQCPG